MNLFKIVPALIIGLIAFSACEETTSIGSSLVEDQLKIVIDSSFTISGHSVPLEGVRSRTTTQMLGAIDVPAYGRLSSSVVTQFTSAVELDTASYRPQDVDSLNLIMRCAIGGFIGDSIVPMGLTVYPLTKQLPSPIFSDFNPEGYYDKSKVLATATYNMSSHNSDSIRKLGYRDITIRMPRQLGVDLFQKFVDDPSLFATPASFTSNVFPGVYVASTFGSGRLTLASLTAMRMFCSRIKPSDDDASKLDTIHGTYDYFVVTPEVVSNNNLSYTIAPQLKAMADKGDPMIVAPTGYEVEAEFPAADIISAYKAAGGDKVVVNSLAMWLPVDTIVNDYGVAPPPYLLMVLKNKRADFFANNELPDNQTSFYATYDSTRKRYVFSGMKGYLTSLLEKESITPDDYTFTFCPVLVTFETITSGYQQVQIESTVVPYITAPSMAKLSLDKAKIKFTYSLQTRK